MRLSITYPTSPVRRSAHTSLVADHFGLADVPPAHVVADTLELPIEPGTVVAFTGPSGSGKSSLLRAAAAELKRNGAAVLRPDDLSWPDRAVIDALDVEFDRAMALLSSCGLAEPRLMLRRPAELSDGERWRFRLALALARDPTWIVADEFTAPLDRTLAKVIAFNVRRQCDRAAVGFLVATCHEDVLDDLRPDLHVRCDHDGLIDVALSSPRASSASLPRSHLENPSGVFCRAGPSESARSMNVKRIPSPRTSLPQERGTIAVHREERSWSASPTNSNSRPARSGTGRIFHGGITDRIASAR